MKSLKLVLSLVAVIFAFNSNLKAQYEIPKQELGIYEHLDSIIDPDFSFADSDGKIVKFGDLIKKPTVIALVYYECPGICTPLLNGLTEVMNKSELVLGKDYNVVTISFDHGETPVLAHRKKETYKKLIKAGNVQDGWQFLTGDSLTIDKFLDEIGFKVKKQGDEYVHPAAIIMLSPDRKITRYLNGVDFLPFDFKMAVTEASKGVSAPTINKMLSYCFSYDPEGKKYVFNITKVSASIILFFAALLLFFMVMKEIKRKKNLTEQNNN